MKFKFFSINRGANTRNTTDNTCIYLVLKRQKTAKELTIANKQTKTAAL